MGNYVETADIANKGALSDVQVGVIISVAETFIEWYCQDIFREENKIVFFDGNGRKSIPFQFMYDITSCTKIERVAVDDSLTVIASTSYVVDPWSVSLRYGRWEEGSRNYKFTGKVGHAATDLDGNTDNRYMPNGIKEATKTLTSKIIKEFFDSVTGTHAPDEATDRMQSETITDYSYTIKKMQGATLSNPNPTGNMYVDMILGMYKRRDPVFAVLYEQQEGSPYDSLYTALYAGSD